MAVSPANTDAELFAPVLAGHWKQHELWDGTYTYSNFLDILEVMLVQNENKFRDYEHAKRREAT